MPIRCMYIVHEMYRCVKCACPMCTTTTQTKASLQSHFFFEILGHVPEVFGPVVVQVGPEGCGVMEVVSAIGMCVCGVCKNVGVWKHWKLCVNACCMCICVVSGSIRRLECEWIDGWCMGLYACCVFMHNMSYPLQSGKIRIGTAGNYAWAHYPMHKMSETCGQNKHPLPYTYHTNTWTGRNSPPTQGHTCCLALCSLPPLPPH